VTPDSVLAGIDATLQSWETGEDAAQWHADGGPDELAEEEYAGIQGLSPTLVIYDEAWQIDTEALAAFGREVMASMDGVRQWAQQVWPPLTRAMNDAGKLIASAYGFTWDGGELHYHTADAPRRLLRRCRLCSPQANPLPLAVDGHDYRRRQLARRRRRR
jgi:hypothetical protein